MNMKKFCAPFLGLILAAALLGGIVSVSARSASQTPDAEEQVVLAPVKYPLAMPEEAVDQLIPYMELFHILTLDANDQTNWLDICLSDYSEDNLRELTAVIESLSIPAGCVNYIDCTGQTNQLTAGSGG